MATDNDITIANKALTHDTSSKELADTAWTKQITRWVVVVRDQEYELTPQQAHVLSTAISQGSRGIIMFPEFAISIPYIQEFYSIKALRPKKP